MAKKDKIIITIKVAQCGKNKKKILINKKRYQTRSGVVWGRRYVMSSGCR